jgi:Fe-S-cluster-containing dehydrogenase component
VAVCPSGALQKLETGQVILDESLCVGCGACQYACHLGIPEQRRDGRVMVKCDLCPDRLKLGMEPACVSSCKTDALTFEFSDKEKGKATVIVYQTAK